MRAIDKQGKIFEEYFYERLLSSLRSLKIAVDKYYLEEGDFNLNEKNISRTLDDHFSLVDVLKTCGFYPEDYVL